MTSFFRAIAVVRMGVAASAVLVLGASQWGLTLQAQQRPGESDAVETIQIRPNVYVIFSTGGNVTAHVGEDGVILVDSGATATAEKVLAAVKAISSLPIRLIVNTSADADHVGGNEILAAPGVAINPDGFSDDEQATVLAHENVLTRMSANETAFPVSMWPTETYTALHRSMYVNDDAVQVLRQTGAHSDGDSIVHFRRADVIATGDMIDLRHFPVIDPARGGSIQGELDALNRLLELTVPAMPLVLKPGRTLLVPGHGRISDYSELVEYRDMVTVIRDIIQDRISKGMTLQQVKASDPTKGYRGRYGRDTGPWTTDMFVEAIYNGLRIRPRGPGNVRDAHPARRDRLHRAAGAVVPRRTGSRSRRATCSADTAIDGADRSHRQLGRHHLRGLALAHGDAAQGRLPEHSDQHGRAARRRSVGSGEGRSGRRTVQGLRRPRAHAGTHPPAHQLAGRQYPQAGNRLRHPDPPVPVRRRAAQPPGPRSWQGSSRAEWNIAGGGRGRGAQRFGSMRSVTTNLRPGYLRKNGIPYSANAVYTEHWDLHTRPNGDRYLVITSIVEDPTYLQMPWTTALHFKQEPDGSKWDPTPCDARF